MTKQNSYALNFADTDYQSNFPSLSKDERSSADMQNALQEGFLLN